MEQAIYSILSGDSTVAGLVSDRIYPNFIPQDKDMPGITYNQISGERLYDLQNANGMVDSRYQISCWSTVYTEARSLADAVRGALSNFSGTAATIVIDHITLISETDLPSYGNQADVITRFGKALDFIIWFRE